MVDWWWIPISAFVGGVFGAAMVLLIQIVNMMDEFRSS
jgi:hypothetical protein